MPLTDQWQGYANLPDFPDPATIPTDLKNLFDFLASRSVPRYGSPAERDAELSSPTDGQLAWVDATSTIYARSGGSWRILWEADTGWIDLSSTLVSPATDGMVFARGAYGSVQITGEIDGDFPDGQAVDVIPPGMIPANLRPGDGLGTGRTLATGVTYLTPGGYMGGILARPDGSLAFWHQTGVSARNAMRFTLTYTKG